MYQKFFTVGYVDIGASKCLVGVGALALHLYFEKLFFIHLSQSVRGKKKEGIGYGLGV